MKNSFSDVSRKWILPNMVRAVSREWTIPNMNRAVPALIIFGKIYFLLTSENEFFTK